MAGVINLILKKNFQGLQLEGQVGQSQRGDNRSGRIAVLAGTAFAGGKGHITVSADYDRELGVRDISNRDWGRNAYGRVDNACPLAAPVSANCPTGGNGQPPLLILPDAQFSTLTPGGLINSGPLKGIAFGPGGALYNFAYGQYANAGGTSYMSGGGQPGVNFPLAQQIIPPYRRANLYTRGSYELTPSITAWTEASYAWQHGGGTSTASRNTSYVIRNDNPFIPAALRTLMTANNVTTFNLGRTNFDIGVTTGDVRQYTGRVAGGLTGTLPIQGGWKWDLTAGYGQNRNSMHARNNLIGNSATLAYPNMALAVDAVVNPANGQIVCRSTLTNPANGCVPINLFGFGSPSQLAKQYVAGTAIATTIYKQTTASGNITGEPFGTWAGPVSVATGFEYRAESQASNVDLIAISGSFDGANGAPTQGKFNVKEVYFESVIPLANDMAFAKSFDLNGAVRYADYSTSAGGQLTWKVGATYTPVTGLLFRAARSHDIRAPNIYDLYNPGGVGNAVVNYPTAAAVRTLTKGNPNLTAEAGETTTFGVSYSPTFVRGLQVSVDYYKIDLKDAIGTLTAQQIADLCRIGGEASACSLIAFSAGVPTTIAIAPLNLAAIRTRGYDFQASYRTPLSRIVADAPGSMTFTFGANYVLHSSVNTGAPGALTVDRAGELGGPNNPGSIPRFRFNGSLTYDVGKLMVSAQARYISSGKYDNTFVEGVNINDNTIPAIAYVDLSAAYHVTSKLELFGVINNALDKDPPPDPHAFQSPTNPVYYDLIGRSFRVGARYKY
ncbi:MAG: TonB-dependent receptor [Caulobacteraceae bacterium]